MSFERKTPLDRRSNPCLCCPTIPAEAPLDKIVAVGFGSAMATCDGEFVADGENGVIIRDGKPHRTEDFLTFADIEELAVADPDHDWQISLHGPMHGETYQRQDGKWLLVEKNEGFA